MNCKLWNRVGLAFAAALAFGTLGGSVARAAGLPAELKCGNAAFAGGIGADLKVTLAQGVPTHAELTLRDHGPLMGTSGSFNALAPTHNENGTAVSYFQWYAGFGGGASHGDLIPRRMVIYALESNYLHDASVYLGTIEWTAGGKVENHHRFQCQAATVSH